MIAWDGAGGKQKKIWGGDGNILYVVLVFM